MRGRRAHWDHLHSRGHHARQRGGDRARALVTLVHLDLVLRLHAGADGAPHQIGKELDTIGDLSDLLAAGDARDDVEDAGDVLEGDHGADDAVVAFGRLDPQLVLDHEPRRCNTHGKAAAHLEAQATRWAALLTAPSRARACPVAANVS